jgi:translocation and assembly module TamB
MSWQAAGTLRLTGTPEGGLVSGRVQIERVNMTGGLETAGNLMGGPPGGNTASSSAFLRNLQFDVEAVSTPDARMEWPSAELEAEANLRVRGTWDHPILLGHIHVLSGDLYFHGSRYRVARGDLNFANPFQLNPDINVEATTTIQQYEITLNFSGPANKLSLSYRSDPPLPSNDIITLLALGQTSAESEVRSGGTGAGASSAGTGASQLLSEAISSQLGGRLERLFGITRLRVDPGLGGVGSTGTEQNAAARGYGGAADCAQPDDHLRKQRQLHAATGDPGRVQREPERVGRGAAGLQRNVRHRCENQEAVRLRLAPYS